MALQNAPPTTLAAGDDAFLLPAGMMPFFCLLMSLSWQMNGVQRGNWALMPISDSTPVWCQCKAALLHREP